MTEVFAADRAAPVVVEGRLEPPSRWLWLVKWLLLVPHYVVLLFLWVAFAVVTVVALFAILITGRYPQPLFSFNLGVLRWAWRVAYYGYSALGTDRYPPFTLADDPHHPARLDVARAPRMSRGLVLVKWWLLALPHYLVLGVVLGGASWAVGEVAADETATTAPAGGGGGAAVSSAGLLGLLVLFAAIALLFTARYPRGLHELVVGLDRWVLRVVAYAALMTDAYPPFRLDQGGADPARPIGPPPPSSPAAAALAQPAGGAAAPRGSAGAGSVVALVVGLLALLPGLVLTGLGVGGLVLEAQRDEAGFVSTDAVDVASTTAAVTIEGVDVDVDPATPRWVTERFGTLRVRATAPDGQGVFVGIAPDEAVDAWLAPVAHDQVQGTTDGDERTVTYRREGGRVEAGDPADQVPWALSASGTGTQELLWPVEDGRWALVVARPDGSPGVEARVDAGVRLPGLTGAGTGLLLAGALLLLAGAGLVVLGAAGIGRATAGPDGGRTGPAPRPDAPPPGSGPTSGGAPGAGTRGPVTTGAGAPR